MTEIETLRKMIEDAKKENDEVLVEYLNKALQHILEKENTNKQEVPVEEKKEEKEIEKTISNGNTTLTKYKDGNAVLDSKYMDVSVKSNNKMLKINLESTLVTIALDELNQIHGEPSKSIRELISLIYQSNTEEDLIDISNYLKSVGQVGEFGSRLNESLQSSVQARKAKLANNPGSHNINIEFELDDIKKEIAMADMELDELESASMKDPEDFYALAGKYEKQIKNLEDILPYVEDPKKKDTIKIQIADLRDKVINLRKYAQSIEELGNISFEM